jgi:hypothetical protein
MPSETIAAGTSSGKSRQISLECWKCTAEIVHDHERQPASERPQGTNHAGVKSA